MTQDQRKRLKALSTGRMYHQAIDYFYLMSWGYTVFGKVIYGMDVVDAIRDAETSRNPRYSRGRDKVVPVEPIMIRDVRRLPDKPTPAKAEAPRPSQEGAPDAGDAPSPGMPK
jgi:hypothetical protein